MGGVIPAQVVTDGWYGLHYAVTPECDLIRPVSYCFLSSGGSQFSLRGSQSYRAVSSDLCGRTRTWEFPCFIYPTNVFNSFARVNCVIPCALLRRACREGPEPGFCVVVSMDYFMAFRLPRLLC